MQPQSPAAVVDRHKFLEVIGQCKPQPALRFCDRVRVGAGWEERKYVGCVAREPPLNAGPTIDYAELRHPTPLWPNVQFSGRLTRGKTRNHDKPSIVCSVRCGTLFGGPLLFRLRPHARRLFRVT